MNFTAKVVSHYRISAKVDIHTLSKKTTYLSGNELLGLESDLTDAGYKKIRSEYPSGSTSYTAVWEQGQHSVFIKQRDNDRYEVWKGN